MVVKFVPLFTSLIVVLTPTIATYLTSMLILPEAVLINVETVPVPANDPEAAPSRWAVGEIAEFVEALYMANRHHDTDAHPKFRSTR